MSSKTFQSFAQYNYRLWFGGSIFASTGTWMQRVAQDWLVLTVLTHNSGFQVGIVTALQFLPILLLSPVAGVAADRFNRRHLLQTTQVITGLLGMTLGVLILSGTAQLWMVYILAFLGGSAQAFDNPSSNAFVSELVPARMLPNAVALNSTAFNSARLIGPALSGVVIDWIGIGWVFVVNAGLFAVPVIAMGIMRKNELDAPMRVPKEKGQVREGLAYIRERKDIILILVLMGVVSCLVLNFQLTSSMMATGPFGLPAGGYGLMSTAMAVGAVAGTLLVARHNHPRLRMIILAALFFGVGLGALALSPSYYWFLILAIPTGLLSMSLISSANAAVQISTEPRFRGRVMAIYSMIFLGTTPIGAPIIGWVGEHWGPRWAMGVGAIASVVAAIGVALWGVFKWKVRLHVSWVNRSLQLEVPELAWKRPRSADGGPPVEPTKEGADAEPSDEVADADDVKAQNLEAEESLLEAEQESEEA
mgnify:FL=1